MSATTTSRLKVSREGVVLIKSFEGFRPRAVRGEDGRWVIGYGHTASAREGLTVGEHDAELLLQYDLLPVVKALNEGVAIPLNQHQFDALASFAVSVGVDRFLTSDVLQRLNEGRASQAADALIGWPEEVTPDEGLRRRAAERALFVADPSVPVTLADLLAAPLPLPPGATDAKAATPEPVTPEPAWAPEEPGLKPPAFEPADAVTTVNLNRYSPYAVSIVGPLPGFGQAPAEPLPPPPEPEPQPALEPAPVFVAVVETAAPTEPITPMLTSAPLPSPFPPAGQELVLTPATEADFAEAPRPAWPAGQRSTPPAASDIEETVLFEDEPTLSVLRHEIEPTPSRRFDWSESGAYLIMGGVGLVACGASAAAFRLAVEQPSPMGETTVIAWSLALIGVICVGVSCWKLYVRWGKPD